MTFLSPQEDFTTRTLASVRGVLAKLAYLVQLREGDRYEHWGMSRAHGDAAAQSAIAASHTHVFTEVLATPLEELRRESQFAHDDAEHLGALRVLHERRRDDALPSDRRGGSAAHLNFVLESLWLVEQASTRPAA